MHKCHYHHLPNANHSVSLSESLKKVVIQATIDNHIDCASYTTTLAALIIQSVTGTKLIKLAMRLYLKVQTYVFSEVLCSVVNSDESTRYTC